MSRKLMKDDRSVESDELFRVLGHDELFKKKVQAAEQVLDFLMQAKARMQDRGLKQADLARRLGLGRSQINRWLHDESGLNAKSMFLLASALGYRLDLQWHPVGPRLELINGGYQVGETQTISAEVSRPPVNASVPVDDGPALRAIG